MYKRQKVEWAKNVRAGYLDQHAVLEKGMTIADVLRSAFLPLFEMEERMNGICDRMAEADPEELERMMEELGTIQDLLSAHDFYIIDAKAVSYTHLEIETFVHGALCYSYSGQCLFSSLLGGDVYKRQPYLLQHGFLSRTPRGRTATEKAYHHLGLEP